MTSDQPTHQATRDPSIILTQLATVLETALNQLIKRDPALGERIATLEGETIDMQLNQPKLAMRVLVRNGQLLLGPALEQTDVSLSVSTGIAGLMDAINQSDTADAKDRLRISGDVKLAQAMQDVLDGYKPDLAALLAPALGEIASVQVARGLLGFGKRLKQLFEHGTQDIADFALDNAKVAVRSAEVEAFNEDVDALRNRVDRLAQRVKNLEGTS